MRSNWVDWIAVAVGCEAAAGCVVAGCAAAGCGWEGCAVAGCGGCGRGSHS